jgi:hypothetical protein
VFKVIGVMLSLVFLAGCATSKIPVRVSVPSSVMKAGQLTAVDACKFGCSVYDTNLRDVGSWGFLAMKYRWLEYSKGACESRCEAIPYESLKRGVSVQEINP